MIGVIGARFTGRFVVDELLRAGESVTVLARDPESTGRRLDPDVPVHSLDLDQPFPDLPDLSCVVSTAPIQMAASVVRLCEHIGTRRAIFIGSTWRHTTIRTAEVDAVVRGEEAVTGSDLTWTILRPTMIYGPGDRNVSVLRARIAEHRILPIVGSGERMVQPVFVADVANAVSAAVARKSSEGRCFEVCGPEPMTYTQMVDAIAASTNRHPVKVYVPLSIARLGARVLGWMRSTPSVTLDQVNRMSEDRHFDISETTEALGYFPRPFEEGLKEMVAA